MTVLAGLFFIQEKLDGSLAFRSSCRAGVCGSCAMHISGSYRLACETQLSSLQGIVRIRPLAHLPLLKDLFVDMEPFWEKYRSIRPYLLPVTPAGERERLQSPAETRKLDGLVECILCASCHASCTMTETDPEYLGPAVLMKAARFVLDSRDGARDERIMLSGGEDGIWRCHTLFNCQAACPKKLDPTGAIASLKRDSLRDLLRPA